MRNKELHKVKKAVDTAMRYHTGWRNATGLPYIYHPLEVSKDMCDRGIKDENVLCAAVLHDTLEDTKYTEQQMLVDFGSDVLNFVKECSKIGIDDEGIEEKMKFLKSFSGKSFTSLLIKLSDRMCNIKDYQKGNREWYPGYYSVQAYPLVHHFMNNKDNIVDMFSEHIHMNYFMLISDLHKIVENQYNLSIFNTDEKTISIMDDILKYRKKGIFEK